MLLRRLAIIAIMAQATIIDEATVKTSTMFIFFGGRSESDDSPNFDPTGK